jgi:hypothetical protein
MKDTRKGISVKTTDGGIIKTTGGITLPPTGVVFTAVLTQGIEATAIEDMALKCVLVLSGGAIRIITTTENPSSSSPFLRHYG